jgi:myo-inositol-1(or 4)-monophosphatase
MLEIAIRAAREAGELLLAHMGRRFEVSHKAPLDIVTEVDIASETLIKEIISTHYPRHAVLAEESGLSAAADEAEYRWIVDPLDGTTNYAHGYPCFCVSIAVARGRETILGVVYDPTRDELFVAERGAGATLNNRPIRVSSVAALDEALLVTGFPFDLKTQRFTNLGHFEDFCRYAQAVRRDGSAALDLCAVACGRFEGYWELTLNAWDTAAGALVVTEAGGRMTNASGGPFDDYKRECVASNGLVHDEMLRVLALRRDEVGRSD